MSDDTGIINGITLKNIQDSLTALKTDIADIRKAIGYEDEDEHGKKIGTGLSGRLMRLETKAYRISDKAIGAGAVIAVCLAIVWFVIKDKVGVLLQ